MALGKSQHHDNPPKHFVAARPIPPNSWKYIITVIMILAPTTFVALNLFKGTKISSDYYSGLSSAPPHGFSDSPGQQQLLLQQLYKSLAALSSSYPFGLIIPEGPAEALPSVPTTQEEESSINRNFYGGKGDKAHLGGFTSIDVHGISPTLWNYMISHLGIKSLLDVGCGRGISTSWFILHGLDYVECVEGSHDAISQSLIPQVEDQYKGNNTIIVEHDFSRGPWWPSRTVDTIWCVEFTEHVGRNYQPNYLTAFRKAAMIFMTHSNWGGWHHVEVHNDDWWIVKMESMGFLYSEILTRDARAKAGEDSQRTDIVKAMEANKGYSVAQHLTYNLLVFVNPLVASLPQHAHLFAEHGCFDGHAQKTGLECGGKDPQAENLTPLPERFKPLIVTKEMDDRWFDLVKDLPLV